MSEESIQLKTNKFDIHVEELEYHPVDGVHASFLNLKFSGKDFNIKLMNSIRRASVNNVPTYAIAQEAIKIDINTAVAFNNDYMKLRLSQLPVLGVDSGMSFLPEKYWHKNKVNFSDQKRDKHPAERAVEFYINAHNNSADVVPVTTNDMKMYIDGEEVHPYDKKYPILLIQLRPNNRFKCYMRAFLGTGDRNIIWSASRNSYYHEDEKADEDDEHKDIYFTVEGNNQCNEYEILVRSCKFLIKKYSDLKRDLETRIETKQILPEKVIYLKLDNENHTIGEPMNYEFQNHPDIIRSGVTKPDQLVESMLIKIEAAPKVKSPLDAMLESIDITIKKLSHVGKLIDDMNPEKGTKKSSKKTEEKPDTKKTKK
jgi:DNA-directed RNA polymerase subunit L